MSIMREIQEFTELDIEIKRLRKEARRLEKMKRACERHICEYIDANNLPGIRYRDKVFYADRRVYRTPLKKEDKQNRIASALRKHGMPDNARVVEDVAAAIQGPTRPDIRVRVGNHTNRA